MKNIERRFAQEMRADSQGDEMSLVGYAAKFNKPSEDLGGFRETIMPGAFARSIREGQDVKFLMNHDPSLVMGRTKNKTLTLEEDGVGLRFRCVLPNTTAARDLYALVQRGDIDQCSFAFIAKGQSWENERSDNGDMYANRKLMDVDLQDASAVTYPAYGDTDVTVRMFDADALVEVRSAVKKLEEERGGPGSGRHPSGDTKNNSENAKTSKEHKDAADYHDHEANIAADKADVEEEKGNIKEADRLNDAANDHDTASAAHTSASEYQDTRPGSRLADKVSKAANKMSKNVHDKYGVRSINDSGKRGSEAQPPRPNAINLPQPFDSDMKQEWWDAFMVAYSDLLAHANVKGENAIAQATAIANQKVQPATEVTPEVKGQEKDPTSIKDDVVDTSARSQELRYAEGTFEDRVTDINQALCNKFGYANYGYGRYCIIESYPDHVIVCDNMNLNEPAYFSIDYTYDEGAAKGEQVTLGELVPVEQQYVPTERMLKLADARKIQDPTSSKKRNANGCECDCEDCLMGNCMDCDDPDCDDPNCDEYRKKMMDDGGTAGADTDGKKTKKVGERSLPANRFAWVPDETDPSTWKLPIDDESLTSRSIQRFHQVVGIPEEKKEGVWRTLVAAAREFKIEVTEKDSLRAAISHEVAKSIISNDEEQRVLSAMKARVRLIEIELE